MGFLRPLICMFQASGGDIFDFINTKLGGKRGKILLELIMIIIY